MQFLQAILSKHQQPQRTIPRRDIKINGYTGLYSDLLAPQTPSHYRSESCHLASSQKLGHTYHHFNYSPLEPSNTLKRSHPHQQQLTVTPQTSSKHLNDFCSSADIAYTTNTLNRPDFFVTIYAKDQRQKLSPSRNNHSSAAQAQQKTGSMLQIQVNKLPIIRKRQSKRKILAEAFRQRAQLSPQVASQVRSFPRAYQPPPEPPRDKGQGQKTQICGWQQMDAFD